MTTAREIAELLAEEAKRFEEERERAPERTYAQIPPAREPSQVYSVRIPKNRLAQLRILAEREGKQPTSMIREWVLQRLEEEETLKAPNAGLSSRLAGQVVLRLKQAMEDVLSHMPDASTQRPKTTARKTVERTAGRKTATRKKTSAARKSTARKKTSVARKKTSAARKGTSARRRGAAKRR